MAGPAIEAAKIERKTPIPASIRYARYTVKTSEATCAVMHIWVLFSTASAAILCRNIFGPGTARRAHRGSDHGTVQELGIRDPIDRLTLRFGSTAGEHHAVLSHLPMHRVRQGARLRRRQASSAPKPSPTHFGPRLYPLADGGLRGSQTKIDFLIAAAAR